MKNIARLSGLLAAASLGLWLALTSAPAPGAPSSKQLTIGIAQEFEILNPVIAQMNGSLMISHAVSHPLVSIDADWNWKCWMCKTLPTLENGLARRVQEGGKEKLVVDWEIIENAKWGDGTPVTGQDILTTWEIGRSPNVAVGEKDLYMRIESITIDPKNPKKFSMKFAQARYDYYQLGTFYIVPAHIEGPIFEKSKGTPGLYEKQTAYNTNPTQPGLYSGPYVVKEIKLGSHVMLERSPTFYGKPAGIERIIYKYIPDTATLESNLLSGTIDMICEVGIKLDQALQLEARLKSQPELGKKFQVNYRDGITYEHIELNLRNPILADLKVRQALLHAIDRKGLTQALFKGRQLPALHVIHPLDVYYTEDVPKHEFDKKVAERLLDEAGWKRVGSDKVRSKGGEKLSLSLMTTAQDKSRERVQVYLQQSWAEIGIDLKIKNEPARVFFGETVRKAAFPAMAMFAWISSPDNPPRSLYHSSEIPSAQNNYSGQNVSGWSNKVVDETLDKILGEFNLDKRREMMKTVLQEYAREIPVLPLYYRVEISVTPTSLAGFRMTGHQFVSTMSIQDWTIEGPPAH